MRPPVGHEIAEDQERVDNNETSQAGASQEEREHLGKWLLLAPIAFALLTWSLAGSHSLQQTILSFLALVAVLALMVGLARGR